MPEQERYATIGTWAKVFRGEGVEIGETTIRKRIKKFGLIGKTGLSNSRKLLLEAFYAESDVRQLCTSLFQKYLEVDESGFINHDAEIYGTVKMVAERIGKSRPTIMSAIKKSKRKIRIIKGKNRIGRIYSFYALEDVRKLFSGSQEKLSHVNDEGVITIGDGIYATVNYWAKKFGLSATTIDVKLRSTQQQVVPIIGVVQNGNIHNFYEESYIRSLCADLIAKRSEK